MNNRVLKIFVIFLSSFICLSNLNASCSDKDLNDWASCSGYCYFKQITEVGTWLFNEKENAYEKVGE